MDNSDEDEGLDTFCDEVAMKSKSCSASDSSLVKVSPPLSSTSPSPSKKPPPSDKVDRKDKEDLFLFNLKITLQTKERESTICLGGELASYDEVKVRKLLMKSQYQSILFVLLRKTL